MHQLSQREFVHIIFTILHLSSGLLQPPHHLLDARSLSHPVLQAALNHLDQGMPLPELPRHLPHVVATTLQFCSTHHPPTVVHVCSCQRIWKYLGKSENCENSERKDIDCDIVSRFIFQSLWRHVDGGSWCLGHGGGSQTRKDASHAQVGYLGHHPLVQENVSGRQVAVDDGR